MKRARLLSQNQIREIVMDSDSGEDKYYTSENTEDEEEPHPPSRLSSISQPPSPEFPRFVWTEIVLQITTQKITYKTYFHPSSMQTVEASTTM